MYAELCFPVPLNRSFTYAIPDGMELAQGYRVKASFGRKVLEGWVLEVHQRVPDESIKIKFVDKVEVAEPLFDDAILDLARWLAHYYFSSIGEALDAMLPGAKRPRSVETQELADMDDPETEELLGALDLAGSSEKRPMTLSQAQISAIAGIKDMDQGLAYLYGATGSGKTEVFLNTAAHVLARGKGIIYLVPEIALTAQVIDDIRTRFGEQVAVLHSRLTKSQRLGEWRRIQNGQARLVVGARSAVFAPVKDLGLIILDEEHEGSYKSGSSPRYHARQVAMHRIARSEAVLLMGSATPSVEAWKLMEDKRIVRFHLPERVSGGAMPRVELSGLKGSDALSPALVEALRETAAEKAQSILFLNRRGFSHFTFCQSCGDELRCEQCSVPMTFHKQRNRMVCHYCGRTVLPPQTCPSCHANAMAYAGFGTEFVEDEVRKLFPHLRIARLDTDSVRKKGQLESMIDSFRKGEIDILLGTQMVAKGLNFPNLKLVGVILGDGGLHMPDFRAAERTFNLLVQVAGRAGRFRNDGLVLVQAAQPEHPVIQLASRLEVSTFYARELAMRKELGFPPYRRLIRMVFRSPTQEKARQASALFIRNHGEKLRACSELLGPAECPLLLVNGSFRYHLILASAQFGTLHRVLAEVLLLWKDQSGVYLELDVDPVSMV